jgi:hypothetical protein
MIESSDANAEPRETGAILATRELDKRIGSEQTLRYWTSVGLAFAVLIGVLVVMFHGGVLTAGLAAFGAALGLGGVLGFLFGVPGTTQSKAVGSGNPKPAAENGAAHADQAAIDAELPVIAVKSHAISNLEQVADWVTKLLLGGGLTQMQRIPPKVWQWAHIVALGIIGGKPGVTEQLVVANQSFAAGLLVYAFVLGFFAGFLITKLQLGKAIL